MLRRKIVAASLVLWTNFSLDPWPQRFQGRIAYLALLVRYRILKNPLGCRICSIIFSQGDGDIEAA